MKKLLAKVFRGLVFLSLSALAGGPLLAQEVTASIRGTVLDPSGAGVPRAEVTAIQVETGFVRKAHVGADGSFVVVLLPVGSYRLEVAAPNFQKYVREGVSLSVNQTASITVHLVIGSEQQVIQVKADAPLIETANTNLGKTVYEREILDLPLNGRNFSQLGLLQPGVAPITAGLQDAGGGIRDGQTYAVNGQRPESNDFLIDGASNFNGVDGGFILKPPIDATAEFKILTHTASAEFGDTTGSTTNIVTRSGSNQLHGSLFEFFRNDKLDARNFFSTNVEPLKQNQFGGTLGGPLRRDKTFFFGYYEGFRNRQGETRAATVPSLLERQGDFSQTVDPSTGQVQPLINFFTGQPVPGNKLPFINPISQNILQFYPLPNAGLNLFVTTQTLHNDEDQFGIRVDHYLTDRDTLMFRYMFGNGSRLDPLSPVGANVPGFPVGLDNRAQNFVAQETHAFSPTLIGLARFSFLRNKFLFNEHLNHTLPSDLGFEYQPTLAVAAGPPFINIAGYASVGDPITGPRDTYENSFETDNSLTWVHGPHELKFGVNYRHDQINAVQGIASNGFFVFAPFPLSNSFASFLFGQPVFFLQGGGDLPRGLRGNDLTFYSQDTYKATSRLTLNLGLRYGLTFPYTEIHDRTNLWAPGMQSAVRPDAPAGLLYPGDPGVPRGLIPIDKNAFAPRVGLAWSPTASARWLVTSAYGIFYDPYYTGPGGPLQAPISAPPFLKTPQVNFPNFASPFGNTDPFGPSFSLPMTLLTLDPHLRLPYAQDWNLSVQRQFGSDWLFEVAYVGTKGTRLPRFVEGNPPRFMPGQSTENNVNQRRIYSGCTLASPDACVYGSVGLISGISNSLYNGLQTSLRKRFGNGLALLASYTYSKTIDDVSSFNISGSAAQPIAGENDLAQNPFDLAAERGRSLFDARHRFVLSYEWKLPFFEQSSGWLHQVFANWQANGITTLSTGTPFTVYDPTDVALLGGAPEITGFSGQRPDLVSNPNSGPRTPNQWFNLQAFRALNPVTQAGQFGNEGRNVVEGPGFSQWDFSLFKDIPVLESRTLQFRAEFFNLFNHANFRLPDNQIGSPNFGRVQEALPPRQIQFALKFLF